jgi:hypothetical protein
VIVIQLGGPRRSRVGPHVLASTLMRTADAAPGVFASGVIVSSAVKLDVQLEMGQASRMSSQTP